MTDEATDRQQARDEFRQTMEVAEQANAAARKDVSDAYALALARAIGRFVAAMERIDKEYMP